MFEPSDCIQNGINPDQIPAQDKECSRATDCNQNDPDTH
jgi:hypothetical protein